MAIRLSRNAKIGLGLAAVAYVALKAREAAKPKQAPSLPPFQYPVTGL